MKHGNIYLRTDTNQEYVLCEWGTLWYLLPIQGRHIDAFRAYSTEAMDELLKNESFCILFDSYKAKDLPTNNNNINLSGDECRALIGIITSDSVTFGGNLLPFMYNIYRKLMDIHINQPPVQENQNESE